MVMPYSYTGPPPIISTGIIRIFSFLNFNCLVKTCQILLLLFFNTTSYGQSVRRAAAALYTRLGSYSIIHVDVFSFSNNQAALSQMKNASAGVYGERRFLLSELSLYHLAVAVPTKSGNFGFKTGYFGFSEYNESQMGLAYARRLGSKVDIGVQFNYNAIRINSYGNASAINFEIGTILHLTDKLNAGLHAYNPIGGKFGKEGEEKLASVYSVGLGYDASDIFFVSAEIEKEENHPVNINAGLQYRIIPQLMVRGGIETNTSSLYIGAGLFLKTLRLDITTSIHPELGITPGLLLIYNFPSKTKE
jgi:hypothetical protein